MGRFRQLACLRISLCPDLPLGIVYWILLLRKPQMGIACVLSSVTPSGGGSSSSSAVGGSAEKRTILLNDELN